MTPADWNAVLDTLWNAQIAATVGFMVLGRIAGDVAEFALSNLPPYRAWQRKKARAARLAFSR